jgi:hypothetical protein
VKRWSDEAATVQKRLTKLLTAFRVPDKKDALGSQKWEFFGKSWNHHSSRDDTT